MKPETITRCYDILSANGYSYEQAQTIADASRSVSQDTVTLAQVLWEANASIKTIAGFLSRSERTIRYWKQCFWKFEMYRQELQHLRQYSRN